MKYLLAVLLVLAMAGMAQAAPFLVCDPQAGVTSYKLTGPAWVPATSTAIADGSIRMDVAAATVGTNAITVSACKTDPIWGELCSVAVPFSWSRPVNPGGAANIKLNP